LYDKNKPNISHNFSEINSTNSKRAPDSQSYMSSLHSRSAISHFRLPLRCKRDLRSSGMSRSADWYLPTLQDSLWYPCSRPNKPLQDGTDRLSRNVGKYQSTLRNIPEEQRSQKLSCFGPTFITLFTETLQASTVSSSMIYLQRQLDCPETQLKLCNSRVEKRCEHMFGIRPARQPKSNCFLDNLVQRILLP
jgi:hypothetical protein